MPPIRTDASLGICTSRDPSALVPGECTAITGAEYRLGSPHLYKQAGRSDTSAALGASVQGIVKFQYDSGTDKLIALAGGTVYESAVATSPSFTASALTGLSSTALPQWCGFMDRWFLCNGTNDVRVREASGTWRLAGMKTTITPATVTTITGSTTAIRPTTSTGTYTSGANAYDSNETTFSYASPSDTATYTHTWTFTTNLASSVRNLKILHAATGSGGASHGPDNPKFESEGTGGVDPSDARVTIEVSENAGSTWTTILSSYVPFEQTTVNKAITAGDVSNQLMVRATITETTGFASHKVYDIKLTAGGSVSTNTTNDIFYGYTEVYTDADGVLHEGNMSGAVALEGKLAGGQSAIYGVSIGLPAPLTANANQYYIYRSVDTDGGGFPNMYKIGETTAAAQTWIDDFNFTLTAVPDTPIYPVLTVLYPTGEELTFSSQGPPPVSSIALPFQGCVVYVPTAASVSRRLYYSLPATISPAGCEQVPDPYYLDFQTPRNDTVVSAAITNGGRSLLAFFGSYTMLVNYLPQATDGTFDNRVKEYVSNNRGTAGPKTCCEFTLPSGQTLVASVDALGLWVTNGVNLMEEWSNDLNWESDFSGVDFTSAELVDNTPKRRLELLYVGANGNRYEMHFFYGRMKPSVDGKTGPLITGPHPSGIRCRTFTQIGSSWEAFSGGSASTGKVFLEGGSASDAANGYNSSGVVPFQWTTGDTYLGGSVSNAQILESLSAKFTSDNPKVLTVDVVGFRDVGTTFTATKTIGITVPNNIYIHKYMDRFRLTFKDLTATAAPAFVAVEGEVREAGPSRDR